MLDIDTVAVFNEPIQFFTEVRVSADDVILLDINMPKLDGVEVLRKLAAANCKANIVLASGMDYSILQSLSLLAHELGFNVVDTLVKPFPLMKIVELSKLQIAKPTNSGVMYLNENHVVNITEKEVLNGLKDEQFELFYQPQVDLRSNQIISVEGLIRWRHPRFGILSPDKFLPLLERFNLFSLLNNRIIECVLESEKLWNSLGIEIQASININASSVIDLTLPEKLELLVIKAALEPQKLCLEITESELMTDLINSLDTLTRLRVKGFRLSIDDFGTGFSSLVQLHRIPFTELKIDKSFVGNLRVNQESRVIVEACIFLAQKLNMIIVAEGVEDRETFELLKKLGCNIAQGFYISKPLPNKDLIEFVCNWTKTDTYKTLA